MACQFGSSFWDGYIEIMIETIEAIIIIATAMFVMLVLIIVLVGLTR